MEGRTEKGVRFGEGRKLKEPIKISVKLNSGINTSSCVKIVGDILKYILYQRQQIPVQFDVLTREVAKETGCDDDDDEHSNITQDQTTTIHNRKEERKKRLFNTKRKQWLIKVKHLLESFRNVIEVLRHEFEEGQVKAVNLVLGGSVLTSREVYSIILPDHYTNNTQLNGHHSLIQLFRELVVHEELVNIMSRRCRVQRVWVMILKLKCPTILPSPCLTSTASQTVTSSPQDVCSPSSLLILRPEYTPSIRARVVQINIQHPLSREISMELTPSVGAGITHIGTTHSCGKNGSKRNLCIELSAADKHHQPKDVCYKRDCDSSQYPMDDGSDRFESYVQSVSFSSNREQKQAKLCQYDTPYICKHKLKIQRSALEAPKNSNDRDIYVLEAPTRVQKRSTIETPKNSSGKDMTMSETPTVPFITYENHLCGTPSKILSTQLGNFSLSDTWCSDSQSSRHEYGSWYQIDQPICGFKGVYLKK